MSKREVFLTITAVAAAATANQRHGIAFTRVQKCFYSSYIHMYIHAFVYICTYIHMCILKNIIITIFVVVVAAVYIFESTTCVINVPMMISNIRWCWMPSLNIPIRITTISEIIHSLLLRRRGLLTRQPGHGGHHLSYSTRYKSITLAVLVLF